MCHYFTAFVPPPKLDQRDSYLFWTEAAARLARAQRRSAGNEGALDGISGADVRDGIITGSRFDFV
jgi:hypothetical protein